MAKVTQALRRVKEAYKELLTASAILQVCRAVKHRFRERIFGPVDTLYVFLLQILDGNTACSAVRHLAGAEFTDAAYCQARSRLPLAVFQGVLQWLVPHLRGQSGVPGLWLGHRTFHVDGSSFSMPDTPALQKRFGQPGGQKKGCGFPVAHILALFDAATGLLLDVLASPLRTHDMSGVPMLHEKLRAGDVLVGDRAFCSYAHLALLASRGLHGVFRLHQRILVSFTPRRLHVKPGTKGGKGIPKSRWIKKLGNQDQIVELFKPSRRPSWMSPEDYAALPETLTVRELRYAVTAPGCRTREVTLVTTLLDPRAYPAKALAELYGMRWEIEVNLRHLKKTMGMAVLRCKTVQGVLKELMMFAITYNLVRAVMVEAGRRQDVDPRRISFVDAMRWLLASRDGRELTKLKVVPYRPNRCEPRAVKRRATKYRLLTRPRAELRLALIARPEGLS